MSKFTRGSEWRKWDLHIHTPKSIIQHYGGDNDKVWESYISDLEKLPKEIKAIGINDYIFIDGYKKVLEYKAKGRLENIDLILPVIELRLDKFASVGDEAWKKVNFHIIFSDKIDPAVIEAQFINAIQHSVKVSSDIEGVDFKGVATKDALQDLGRKIRKTASVNMTGTDLEIGFFNICFQYKAVKDALESTYFKDKYLTAVGKTEWDTMRWSGSPAEKKTIINEAKFVFTALERDSDHKKHVAALDTQKVNSRLLDCSDAHHLSSSSDKDRIGNCFTWLKADTTFEGLKQVANDKSRIFIGQEPPLLVRVKQNPTKYIRNLAISKVANSSLTETWFDGFSLDLNPGLVAIIGNKGNGKSAISDTLGLVGNTQNFKDFSFLTGLKFRKRKPINKSEHFDATVTWEDLNEDIKNLSRDPAHTDVEKVKYIPQGFLEKLCNEDVDEFEKELRKVIFSHIPESDRLGQNNLEELIKFKTEIVEVQIGEIKKDIATTNAVIIDLEDKKTTLFKTSTQEKLKDKQNELKAHQVNKPSSVEPPTDPKVISTNKEISEGIEARRKELSDIEEIISKNDDKQKELKINISELEKVLQSIAVFEDQYERLKVDIQPTLTKHNLQIGDIFKVSISKAEINDLLQQKTDDEKAINLELNGDEGLLNKKKSIQGSLKELQDKLDASSKRYQKYIDDLKNWEEKQVSIVGSSEKEGSLTYYQELLNYLEKKLPLDLDNRLKERKDLLKKLFAKKHEIIVLYKSLFKPVTDFIAEYKEIVENYQINLDVSYRLNGFSEKFFDHVSLSVKGSFNGIPAGYDRLNHILENHNLTTEEGLLGFVDEVVNNLEYDYRDEKKEKREISNQLKKGYSVSNLYSYLFNLDYLQPVYQLKLGEKYLGELSPGERGALLLIFYLIIDQDDVPLIIDQPEENLDNQSVFKILVHFIKKAKDKRQIIIVTHNPNLAVVCDAEQIVHVQIDKLKKNAVQFSSGSLEDPNINNVVVDILEGTYPALNTRNATYDVIER